MIDLIGSCSMLFSIPSLIPMMQHSMLPPTSPLLCMVCAPWVHVLTIEKIMAWVKETDPVKAVSVYWLTGLAGLGKTTIAYTICKLLKEARVPFISFFCLHQLDSKYSKLLVLTLCRNLAELFSSYALEVLPILESDSSIVDKELCQQMDELLVKPWMASLAS